MSLIQNLLDIVDEYALKNGFDHVNTMRLSFGRMSCIEPKALTFAFDVLSKGTKAQGAVLEFDILPVSVYCFTCGKETTVETYPAPCPMCNGSDILLKAGTEELKFIEMDVE